VEKCFKAVIGSYFQPQRQGRIFEQGIKIEIIPGMANWFER
jgi:hypothetical protein